MAAVMLVKGDESSSNECRAAIEKFAKIFTETLMFDEASSVSEALGIMGWREHLVVFVADELVTEDLNVLIGSYPKLKYRPYFVASASNVEKLKGIIEDDKLKSFSDSLSKGLVFDYLRALAASDNRKLDPRVFAGILRGFMKTMDVFSGLSLTPQPVKSKHSKVEVGDVTAVCSFYGDGIQGALIVSTTAKFINLLASRVFALPPDEIVDELKNDSAIEMLNQLLGAVGQQLSEFGYELKGTFLFVAIGEGHSLMSRSNGKYFNMPFLCEDQSFDVTFCYDIYSDFLQYGALSPPKKQSQKKYMDVRLMNAVITSVKEVVKSNFDMECEHRKDEPYELSDRESSLVSVAHGVGFDSNYTFVLSLPEADARKIASKILYIPGEELLPDMVADSCGELLNQIIASFRLKSQKINYPLRPVFHIDISRASPINYLLKGQGRFVFIPFQFDDVSFSFAFGIESTRTNQLFDVADWIEAKVGS